MTESQNNQDLINQTIKLMNLSSMAEDERAMWTVVLPSMEATEIKKLKDSLEKEVKQMTDIYLKVAQNPHQ